LGQCRIRRWWFKAVDCQPQPPSTSGGYGFMAIDSMHWQWFCMVGDFRTLNYCRLYSSCYPNRTKPSPVIDRLTYKETNKQKLLRLISSLYVCFGTVFDRSESFVVRVMMMTCCSYYCYLRYTGIDCKVDHPSRSLQTTLELIERCLPNNNNMCTCTTIDVSRYPVPLTTRVECQSTTLSQS
jgi:hypothetical protein